MQALRTTIEELEEKCYTPPHQFGFQRDFGCAEALAFVANVLLDASCTGSSLALASHDVCHVFDSLIHLLMLLRAVKRGVNTAISRSQRDMYAKLRIRLKIPLKEDETARTLYRIIQVNTEAKQGKIASPCYFNSYILKTQDQFGMSCILSGLNISLITYAGHFYH